MLFMQYARSTLVPPYDTAQGNAVGTPQRVAGLAPRPFTLGEETGSQCLHDRPPHARQHGAFGWPPWVARSGGTRRAASTTARRRTRRIHNIPRP